MEIIRELIDDYKCRHNYEPCKITLEVKPPLYVGNTWLNLDSIVDYLCFREALGREFYTLPSEIKIEHEHMDSPLKKTGDMFHASVGIFNHPQLKTGRIYKRMTYPPTGEVKGKLKINSAYFKDEIINLIQVLSDKLTFYACGDMQDLKRLLKELHTLGKKTSVGGGKIKKVKIKPTDADYSFYKDGHVMKCIPLEYSDRIRLQEGDTLSMQNYKPPYWDKSGRALCLTPPNQLAESVRA